ncbi:MAG: shikimate dehydrogenase [SAR86 cluster bacterium]|uniref:Shikimate dehydrogenase (NADP(+)) n=1 Tax=SAR86 cluster bacterium TaxID=2030880 RepID=A0A2A5B8A4_9GAMM|nr:MAG: shikimate dehydrogenase [SAR86 cluster bacterium]
MPHTRSHYAVIGKPVKHSKSPQIHSLFAQQFGQEISYEAIEVEEENVETFVETFFAGEGAGLNITVPYKEKAFALALECSPRAAMAKAVNTLFLDDKNKLCGDNTDGPGLVTDIKVNHSFDIKDKRILILGAGGAVRGALAALVEERAATVSIANRTLSRAKQLCQEFGQFTKMSAHTYEDIGKQQFDLIINGTSMGLTGEVPPVSAELIATDCCCYDMMYGDSDTAFVSWSKQNGATLSLDGLGMLVEQAAVAFTIWHGTNPDTAPVISQLRNLKA